MKIFSFTYCIGVSGLCESLGDHISGGIEFDYRIVKGHDIRILIILYSCFEKDQNYNFYNCTRNHEYLGFKIVNDFNVFMFFYNNNYNKIYWKYDHFEIFILK